ncbi:unnamed protein product [Cochlearia groenlandica]
MDENKSKVTLHGMWASSYAKRVKIALKLKGISYEYVEEDFNNKTETLIKLNPVYKKVPLLVHDGKPVVESLVILEYIDETWKNSPRFFPEDPYESISGLALNEVVGVMTHVLFREGEAQEKSKEEAREKFKVLEDGLKNHFPNKIIETIDDVGLLDIIIMATFGDHKVYREATGVEMINLESTPTLYNWITRLQELDVMKEFGVPSYELMNFLKIYKQKRFKQVENV